MYFGQKVLQRKGHTNSAKGMAWEGPNCKLVNCKVNVFLASKKPNLATHFQRNLFVDQTNFLNFYITCM